MTFRTLLIVASIALFGCSTLRPPTDAVPPSTEREILHAVAAYVLSNIESETAHVERDVDVVLDHAILQQRDEDRGVAWPAEALESIAAGAGVRVGTLADYHTCPREAGPGHCFLEGADWVVTVGRPELDGDEGTILVREVARATADIDSPRAYRSSAALRIARVDGVWEVVGIDSISVSE